VRTLFKWDFRLNDLVEDASGQRYVVKSFISEGYVVVRNVQTGKTEERFGGSLQFVARRLS
jgi:hypothetical protein